MELDILKKRVIDKIDLNKDKIIEIGRKIYDNPELGYREIKTTNLVADILNDLDCDVEKNIVITGCRARIGNYKAPRIALMGELDCICCQEHPDSKRNGEIHACGHNIQIAGLLGAVIGLITSGALKKLKANVDIIAVPSEEFIDMEYKEKLKEEGKIEFFGGKQELIRRGYFDDVDLAMMFHALDLKENKALVETVSNGFIGKKIKFIGKASHAGSAPEKGINALNAAVSAINNIHLQRETFAEKDKVRVHYIITKGGDVVNIIPSKVVMECYVRARTVEAMIEANKKIDRALKAGGSALGAEVEIIDMPGYLPILAHSSLDNIFKGNLENLGLKGSIVEKGDFTGSFDFGDLSQIMPTLHPMIGGIEGNLHSEDYKIIDEELAYIVSAKAMAMTVIDLFYNNYKKANNVIENSYVPMQKEEYLTFMKSLCNKK